MEFSYQPESVTQYFDEFGVKEWERLVQTPTDEVSLYIHAHYLEKFISPGFKVLEIGAGAGRFTQILDGLGAKIWVADISSVQLELNKKFSAEHGFRKSIMDWQQVDICDLSNYASNAFDVVVVYGGPFSYVLDQRDLALSECLRVLQPGGILLLSVMSLWGSAHGFLPGVISLSPEINQKITTTGDLTPATFPDRKSNFMHMFRASELLDWLEKAGLVIVAKSASNCISLTWNEILLPIRNEPDRWSELLRVELEACADEGCLNLGTHIIVAARKLAEQE